MKNNGDKASTCSGYSKHKMHETSNCLYGFYYDFILTNFN